MKQITHIYDSYKVMLLLNNNLLQTKTISIKWKYKNEMEESNGSIHFVME